MSSNTIAGRLTKLRDILVMSQAEFARSIGISQSALSQLESEKTSISVKSIQKISEKFDVQCDWLIRGKGKLFATKGDSAPRRIEKVLVPVSDTGDHLIPLVKQDAHAGYIEGFQSEEFLNALDVYRIPGFEDGNYRLFEISGDSMMPSLVDGDIVISQLHEGTLAEIPDDIPAIVISEQGIVAKRICYQEGEHEVLVLNSDNENYRSYTIWAADVIEIWTIKGKITENIDAPQLMVVKKIKWIEKELRDLRAEMTGLKNRREADTGDPA